MISASPLYFFDHACRLPFLSVSIDLKEDNLRLKICVFRCHSQILKSGLISHKKKLQKLQDVLRGAEETGDTGLTGRLQF